MVFLALMAGPAGAGAPSHSSGDGETFVRKSTAERVDTRGMFVPGELLVRFKPGVGTAEQAEIAASRGARVEGALALPRLKLLRLPKGSELAASGALNRRADVEFAEPNYLYRVTATPNDPRYGELWGLAKIQAPQAWDLETGDSSVIVAVVDSGIAYGHPDIAPNMWVNDDPAGGGDNDVNGFVDDTNGWDFVQNDRTPLDFNGHGTHVAGTIGAQGNDGVGVVGVNWDVSVMAVRAGDAYGSLQLADIVDAFHYAAANGARVVNGSFGGDSASASVRSMIAMHPEVLFVFAAGNDGLNLGSYGAYPCEEHLPPPTGGGLANVVCVAATTSSDAIASFSNRGAPSVHLAAPGVGIVSTVPAYDPRYTDGFDGTLAEFNTRWGDRTSTLGDQLWSQSVSVKRSGTASLADSVAGFYANDSQTSIRNLTSIDLSGRIGCALDYWLRLDTEFGFDGFAITAGTTTSANTVPVAGWTGTSLGDFVPLTEDLSQLDGASSVYLRFWLESGKSVTADGAYVDDVVVKCLSSIFGADDYAAFDGTSMATPHVAGVAALVLAANPSLTPTQLMSLLLANVDVLPSLTDLVSTGGRLNAFKAVSAADDPLPPPSLSIADAPAVLEGDAGTTNAPFSVSLSEPSGTTVTVGWATASGSALAGSDFLAGSGTVTFMPWETQKTVSVAVSGDTVVEPNETFSVELSNSGGVAIPDGTGVSLIVDDDAPPPPPPPPPVPSGGLALPAGCTLVGTAGPDLLIGTPARDVICGLAGGDRIYGVGGNDLLLGGEGNDTLVGGGGHDTLRGEAGRDRLVAKNAGNDRLNGGPGRDSGSWNKRDRARSIERRLR